MTCMQCSCTEAFWLILVDTCGGNLHRHMRDGLRINSLVSPQSWYHGASGGYFCVL